MASPLSLLLLLVLLLLSTSTAVDVPIFRAGSRLTTPPPSTSLFDSVLALAKADPTRLAFLSQLKSTSVPVASGQQITQTPSYVLRASFGTPGQPLLLALDTASDDSWVPCSACSSCPSSVLFNPERSSSYATPPCKSGPPVAPCSYNQSSGGDSNLSLTLSQDTLQLGADAIPLYVFGCAVSVAGGVANLPKQGALGLGRGPMSLISQTGSSYAQIFSYCLPSFRSYYFSGSFRLGPAGQPKNNRTTPLLRNPHRPSLYYVNLTAVSVGGVPVAVPPGSLGFDPATGAGTVLDSGTVITRFVASAYAAIRDEFRRQVNASGGYSSLGAFDTCFNGDELRAAAAPAVTLHMQGLDLALPVEDTLIHSSATPLACLAMAASPDNVNAVVNVIASLQQQNLRVVIDVANARVGFARELCN